MEALILFLLPILPLAAALVLVFFPEEKREVFQNVVLWTSSLCLAGAVFLFLRFPAGVPGYHFIFRLEWLPQLGIQYQVGGDGIDRKSTRLNSSHSAKSRMPSSA